MILQDQYAGALSFSTAEELCAALLASYPGVGFFNAPVAGKAQGRDHETGPAWGWLGQLLRTRTDWYEASGVALELATEKGGDDALVALADLLVTCDDSVVLASFTGPIAERWPDVRSSGAKGYPWPDGKLGDLVARQRAQWTKERSAIVTRADLQSRMAANARNREGWDWLRVVLRSHEPLRAEMPDICAELAGKNDGERRTVLDWFAEEHDLWRYARLLDAWALTPPAWFSEPVTVARGRKNPLRRDLVPDARTLGDVARRARGTASRQQATAVAVAVAVREPGAPPPTLATPKRAAPTPPAPRLTLTFAEHHADIVTLFVLDRDRVLSADRARVVLVWNPLTGAVLARHELPPHAIVPSVVSMAGRLAYLTHEGDRLTLHALDGNRQLARISGPDVAAVDLALVTADGARVLVAHDGVIALVAFASGNVLKKREIASPYHEPKVLALRETDRGFLVDFFHVAMDMYPTEDQKLFDRSTLEEIWRPPAEKEPLTARCPDGAVVTAGPGGTIERWQVASIP